MSDANQDRLPPTRQPPEPEVEKSETKSRPSFGRFLLHFVTYFLLGYLIISAIAGK